MHNNVKASKNIPNTFSSLNIVLNSEQTILI